MMPSLNRVDTWYTVLLSTSVMLLTTGVGLIQQRAYGVGAGLILIGLLTGAVYHHLKLHTYEQQDGGEDA